MLTRTTNETISFSETLIEKLVKENEELELTMERLSNEIESVRKKRILNLDLLAHIYIEHSNDYERIAEIVDKRHNVKTIEEALLKRTKGIFTATPSFVIFTDQYGTIGSVFEPNENVTYEDIEEACEFISNVVKRTQSRRICRGGQCTTIYQPYENGEWKVSYHAPLSGRLIESKIVPSLTIAIRDWR